MYGLINFIFGKKCEFCKKQGFRICPDCLAKNSDLRISQDGIPYFLNYQDFHIRNLIWKLKYKNEYSIAKDLAPLLGSFILEVIDSNLDFQNKPIFIVPAPITKTPERYRLRNHMLIVAQETKKYLKNIGIFANVVDCIDKKGQVRSAETLGKKKRVALIQKVVKLRKQPPEKGLVFLIDDVTTTGATLNKMKSLMPKSLAKVQTVALSH